MRAAIRSLLAFLCITSTVIAGHAGVTLMAASTSNGYSGLVSVLPMRGSVVGVAHPVVLTFGSPVADRAAMERAIEVTSEPAMTGKFEWVDSNVVQWVPDRFWPAHSTVALSVGGLRTEFKTGPAVVGVADVTNHTFTVSIDGVEADAPRPPCRRRITGRTSARRACCRPRWAGRNTRRRWVRTAFLPKTAR